LLRCGRVLRPAAGGRRGDRVGLDIRIQSVDSLGRRLGDAVVVAAGAGTRELLPELPIELEDRFLFQSEPIRERLLEPLIVSSERRFAAKQLGDGCARERPRRARRRGATGDVAGDRAGGNRRAGAPARARVLPALIHGKYDMTPDHQPLLGRVDDGIDVGAGFGGHGFMIAPAVACIVADAVLGEPADEAVAVLDVARFTENRPVPESQLI
jgi:sarcosine oxidase subunit beta